MPVVKISFTAEDAAVADMIIADLSERKYYAFEETEKSLDAFIEVNDFVESDVEAIANKYHCDYEKCEIQEQNWNEKWEASFQPVMIIEKIIIRTDFHKKPTGVEVDIIITPKMSFGTGHHATTFLMIKAISDIDLKNKKVLDFGTGTGVLAIYADKKRSSSVLAIDNDQWSIDNAKENIDKNGCQNIRLIKTDRPPQDEQFDVILANINTHILLKNVENLRSACKKGGLLLLSGFISRDLKALTDAFKVGGFSLMTTAEKDGWYCLLLKN